MQIIWSCPLWVWLKISRDIYIPQKRTFKYQTWSILESSGYFLTFEHPEFMGMEMVPLLTGTPRSIIGKQQALLKPGLPLWPWIFFFPKPKESLLSHLNSWPGSHWKSRKNYRAYPGAPENALGRDQWHHRKWPRRSSRRPRDIWETPRFKNTGNPFQQRPRAIKKPSKAHCGLVSSGLFRFVWCLKNHDNHVTELHTQVDSPLTNPTGCEIIRVSTCQQHESDSTDSTWAGRKDICFVDFIDIYVWCASEFYPQYIPNATSTIIAHY